MQFRRERVRVETQRHIIEGTLQLPHEGYRSRTTDYLNAHDSDFIALIDADVRWADGSREPERQDYLAISARHIILVTELESLGVVEEPNPALGVELAVVAEGVLRLGDRGLDQRALEHARGGQRPDRVARPRWGG